MLNPFKYGRVVKDEDFADREQEIDNITRDLEAGQSVILYSPRRYGKTSLMVEVLKEMKKRGFMTALIDFYGCVSTSELAEKIIEEVVVHNYRRTEALINFIKSELGRLRPQLTLNSEGTFSVSFRRDIDSLGAEVVLEGVLDMPQKVSEKRKKPFVVIFDEFQEIVGLNGERVQKIIRSKIQHHDKVSYVYTGSKMHMLEHIFTGSEKAFYRSAKPYRLERISKEPFAKYIQRKFEETGIPIKSEVIQKILRFTDGHPYFTQQLCHEIWNIAITVKMVEEENFDDAINNILYTQGEFYTHIWDGLSRFQRKVLRALAYEETESPYSSGFISRHRLTSASNIKKSLDVLVQNQQVEKENNIYRVSDIFFKEWIQRTFTR